MQKKKKIQTPSLSRPNEYKEHRPTFPRLCWQELFSPLSTSFSAARDPGHPSPWLASGQLSLLTAPKAELLLQRQGHQKSVRRHLLTPAQT